MIGGRAKFGFFSITQIFIDMSARITSCFGSKRSQVRILSPRPFHLLDFTSQIEIQYHRVIARKSFDKRQQKTPKDRVGRVKFGDFWELTTRLRSAAGAGPAPP